jgi:hypothetical protein
VALVRTDVSEEPGASFIRVTKIGELGTTQAATSNRRTLQRNMYFFAAYVGYQWALSMSRENNLLLGFASTVIIGVVLQRGLLLV